MLRLRLLSAVFISAALAAAACNGSGEHNTPDESAQETTGADSLSAGTAVPSTLPPAGTVNPAAPSGTGSYPDSASPAAVGQSQGATPGSPNPANAVPHTESAKESPRVRKAVVKP